MNRRGFIATLTAIAGAALARIKAPAETIVQGPVFKWIRSGPPGRYTYRKLIDTCPRCGSQAHPGYELICRCSPEAIQQITDEHALPLHIRLKPPVDKP